MKFIIKHQIEGRIRVHLEQTRMTIKQADILHFYLSSLSTVKRVQVYERTGDAVIHFTGSSKYIIDAVKKFSYDDKIVKNYNLEPSARELNAVYHEKLVMKILLRAGKKLLFPAPVPRFFIFLRSMKYLVKGIRCLLKGKLEVEVLDAVAITMSILRYDLETASSVMFLLGLGEILEEWTHKKSVADLARGMSLNIDKVWLKQDGADILVPITKVQEGDLITVHMGNVIPLDGVVVSGDASVNQASLTGESISVKKDQGSYVYAGTVLEEGELVILVKQAAGATRFEKIVTMIEESEKLKSSLEGKAEHLADVLVPYSFGGTLLTYLLTRNVTKALSILMVDFSCALKLAMPLAVLSAMREASMHHITVKGGKYLEAVAEADTIVFDKTGTLTKAKPKVADIITFNGKDKNEMLKIAACLEEHFPHSMANAVVNEAKLRNLVHEEMHTKVDYIVAHGISSFVNNEKVIIGSRHFVFEDEKSIIPESQMDNFNELPSEYSHLYLAVNGVLAAVICIEDPLREEAKDVISSLKQWGFKKVVMMTGDSERTAKAVAEKVGVDEYYSEVLPEDKAKFVEAEKALGKKVIMIGDGINDSPALSAADVGIAISEGAEIAREIADITLSQNDLSELVILKQISNALMKRIHGNYRFVIGFNLGLILLGVGGIITPGTSALLHNTSTLGISVKSMQNLLK